MYSHTQHLSYVSLIAILKNVFADREEIEGGFVPPPF